MQPFHAGRVHDFIASAISCHDALGAVDPSRFNAADAHLVNVIRSQALGLLARYRAEAAVAAKSSFAMLSSDAGPRVESVLVALLDTLDRFQTEINRRTEVAKTAINRIPQWTPEQSWTRFEKRLLQAFDGSPLDSLTKLDLLTDKLDPGSREVISELPYEAESFEKAIEILKNEFQDN
uniref:COMM domain-containing protein n=1 Tax=Panagrellus redivivus TaxID=6233 RepID=A0A7E4W7B7_PANRE